MVSQTTTDYGRFHVTSASRSGIINGTEWFIETEGSPSLAMGSGKEGKKLARTLAAALDAAGVVNFDSLPPGFGAGDRPEEFSDDEWQAWAADIEAVPVKIASAGKAPLAAYLKVVYRQRENWIGNRLDVSEATVRQYLSDLREGRR